MRRERKQTERRSLGGARAFTLIELLVAIVAGLLVAAAVVSFSKQSTRLFAQEARIAASQMSVQAGFQRLQSDVARASFLSTPNMQRDIAKGRVVAPDVATWPEALRQLTGFHVTVEGSPAAALPDGFKPDLLRITGSISSIERFPMRGIEAAGTGSLIRLIPNSGPMARSGFVDGSDLTVVFKPGRVVHVLDRSGKSYYEIVNDAKFEAGDAVIETLGPLPTPEAAGYGDCTGCLVNVVNIIEYGIADLRGAGNAAYDNTIYSTGAQTLGDESRTELVRREILLTGTDPGPIENDPNSEVVAEYALDLRAALWVTNPGLPGLSYLPASSGEVSTRVAVAGSYANADPTVADPPSGPSSIRSVQLRLAVRSKELDRTQDTDQTDPALAGGYMFRYPLPAPNLGLYARVRTLVADVTLHNQAAETVQ